MGTVKENSELILSSNSSQPVRGRLHGPDVLRGFAAIGVVLFHVYYLSGAPKTALIGFFVGRLDFFVRLFFALSAFAIAYAYSARLNSQSDMRNFYLKRFFRLAPLFYFVMLCGALLTLWQGRPGPSFYDYLLSLTFSFSFVPGKNGSIVGGGWSLGLEWIFYIAFPFLLSLARNLRAALALWVLTCILAIASSLYFSNSAEVDGLRNYGLLFILAHLPFFVAGIACFHAFTVCNRRGFVIGVQVTGPVTIALFLITLVYFHFGWTTKIPEEVYLSILAFILIFLAASGFPAWLDNNLTRYLGRLSYSLYLIQFLVFGLYDHLRVFAWLCAFRFNPELIYLLCAAATMIAVIVLSALTYHFIERPGMRVPDWKITMMVRTFFRGVATENAAREDG